ncbi:glycosyltransferase family 2 protein [Sphingomonas sp. RB3P16]|uniref:glycosyltransferase family 2 protein n=1 Tax=Parasphingomonas frigoris TaxID=3096163 RepID=UPI002FCBC603
MSFQLIGRDHHAAFQRGADTAARTAPVGLSIIVPVKDEEQAIRPFLARTVPLLEALTDVASWEILFVDDGSTDATLPIIIAASQLDCRVKAISLSRNFGKEAALSAGLDYATGLAVIPIDVDMQDPPEAIASLVARWREGFEVVYGVRTDRRSDSRTKRWSSSLYYRFHNFISADRIPANAGDFRLLDRSVVEVIRMLPERNRFMKGIFAWSGFKQSSVEYARDRRAVGETKFSYWKLFTLAIDGITASSTVPLRIWSYIGGVIALLAFAYAAFIVVDTMIYGPAVNGYPSIITAVMFLGGIQLVSLGVLGEYIGRILIETKQRPLYVLRSSIGLTI